MLPGLSFHARVFFSLWLRLAAVFDTPALEEEADTGSEPWRRLAVCRANARGLSDILIFKYVMNSHQAITQARSDTSSRDVSSWLQGKETQATDRSVYHIRVVIKIKHKAPSSHSWYSPPPILQASCCRGRESEECSFLPWRQRFWRKAPAPRPRLSWNSRREPLLLFWFMITFTYSSDFHNLSSPRASLVTIASWHIFFHEKQVVQCRANCRHWLNICWMNT